MHVEDKNYAQRALLGNWDGDHKLHTLLKRIFLLQWMEESQNRKYFVLGQYDHSTQF